MHPDVPAVAPFRHVRGDAPRAGARAGGDQPQAGALGAVRAVATDELQALADDVLEFVERVEPRVDMLRAGVLRRVLDARVVID